MELTHGGEQYRIQTRYKLLYKKKGEKKKNSAKRGRMGGTGLQEQMRKRGDIAFVSQGRRIKAEQHPGLTKRSDHMVRNSSSREKAKNLHRVEETVLRHGGERKALHM